MGYDFSASKRVHLNFFNPLLLKSIIGSSSSSSSSDSANVSRKSTELSIVNAIGSADELPGTVIADYHGTR